MTTSTIALLLQVTASLLTGAQRDPSLPASSTAAIVVTANHAVQEAAQAMAPIDFTVPPNNSIWPNIVDVAQAAYLDARGAYVPQGPAHGVTLRESTVSFGDLNADGLDDAAAVVTLAKPDGTSEDALAFFLNQQGVMFNIADLPLGGAATVYSHGIAGNVLTMDMQIAGHARATTTYQLIGDRIFTVH